MAWCDSTCVGVIDSFLDWIEGLFRIDMIGSEG